MEKTLKFSPLKTARGFFRWASTRACTGYTGDEDGTLNQWGMP
ncbi:hypothetical protein [Nostoc sp.]|nr:hypothetical protein [Nostoc sp.]